MKQAIMYILYAVMYIGIIPLATMESLNTLFALDIPFNFHTWACTVFLLYCVCFQTDIQVKTL